MSRRLALETLVHCRAGDKGDDSLLAVVAYEPSDFDALLEALDESLIAAHFGVSVQDVAIRVAPSLGALVVAINGSLGGGVTRSTRIDAHGKTFSSRFLEIEIDWSE